MTAWASASTYRNSDKRGGANGARIRLEPQVSWAANRPEELAKVLAKLESIQTEFNDAQTDNTKISMADLIVLGGAAAIEAAAKAAGVTVEVPFAAGRTDATQEMTEVDSVAYLEPVADGFRNYFPREMDRPAPEMLVDRAHLLSLSAPEMTVLVGGLRTLEVSTTMPGLGVLTDQPGKLTNDFFVNLLDMATEWKVSPKCEHFFEGNGSQNWRGQMDSVVG